MSEFLQQLLNGLSLGAIYALIALGYTMVYGVLRFINFAHSDVFMVGAFVGYYVGKYIPQNTISGGLIVLAIAMLACAVLGMTIERLAYRPLRGGSTLNVLITAIGVSLLLEYSGQVFFGAAPRTFPQVFPAHTFQVPYSVTPATTLDVTASPTAADRSAPHVRIASPGASTQFMAPEREDSPRYTWQYRRPGDWRWRDLPDGGSFAGTGSRMLTVSPATTALTGARFRCVMVGASSIAISTNQLLVIIVATLLMIGLQFIVFRTKIGTAMRAVSLNPQAAQLVGVNNDVVISFTFGLGSALAGAGGILYALNYPSIDPLMGVMPGLKAFVAAVLGGIGNIPGAALGGLILGTIETFVSGSQWSTYKDAIAFAVLIVILLFRPSGLLGKSSVEKV